MDRRPDRAERGGVFARAGAARRRPLRAAPPQLLGRRAGEGGGRRARLCDRPRRLEIVARLGELMVWRAPKLGDHFFVFVRGEEETWPAMEETRRRQASSATQSAVGSAFALGMLNPFFSRAAGARKS